MGPLAWKAIGAGSAVLAGIIANKIVSEAWKRTGRDENVDPNNPDVPLGEALAFALLTGVAIGTARVLATRQAAAAYRRASGHLPADLQKDEERANG